MSSIKEKSIFTNLKASLGSRQFWSEKKKKNIYMANPGEICKLQKLREKSYRHLDRKTSYKGKRIRLALDFSALSPEGRRVWDDIYRDNKRNYNPRILYPAKIWTVGGGDLFFNKLSRWFLGILKFEKHWPKSQKKMESSLFYFMK